MKNLSYRSLGYFTSASAPVSLKSKILKALSPKSRAIIVILLSVSLLLQSQFTNAQAPQQFSFQGVARDATGKIVTNTNVTVRIKIHKDSPNGPVVFSETQVVETNSGGVFNLVVGGLAGGLNNVNWGSDNCFIQSEIDITGGANFVDLGTTLLKSVPYALVSRKWVDNVPIVQTGVVGSGPLLPSASVGANLVWYPRKGAFRVGEFAQTAMLEDAQIGTNSFGAGENVIASGRTAIAIGRGLSAKSINGVAIGAYNDDSDSQGPSLSTDRIFQVGNGTPGAKENAMTILRNGYIGFGNNVLAPAYVVDVGGRMRIRNNGATAGIQFNNSANVEDGFVGMKTDDEVGFYVNNNWRFWVNSSNAYVNGALVNTSDRRLKKEIALIGESLSSISKLKGYHYHWKDENRGKELQTGLIAQEVEKIFPELVTTNQEGYKAVNYIGLIPHLIEAVKELDKKTEEISALKKELASVQEMNKKLSALEASVKELLAGQKATSTQTSK